MKTVFLRVLEELLDKESALRTAIRSPEAASSRLRFDVDPHSFAGVPGSPFAYWVSENLRELFTALPALQADGRVAASGGKTLDDFRWIRAAWEVTPKAGPDWVGFAKGGAFSPFYADVYLLLDWRQNARALKEYLVSYRSSRGWSPNWTAELHGSDHYLRPGLTWSRRTKSELSLRVMPALCVFGDKGPAVFVENDCNNDLLSLLAIGSSKAFRSLVEFQLAAADAKRGGAARSYEVGVLQKTPIPTLTETSKRDLARLAHRAWSIRRSLDTHSEVSHAFSLPALLQVAGADLAARVVGWSVNVHAAETELGTIQAEIDALSFELYSITESDRRAIIDGFQLTSSEFGTADEIDDTEDDTEEPTEEPHEIGLGNAKNLAAELVSWMVGVAFGRFDIRLATEARHLAAEPKSFDPLPVCSPAMLTGDDSLPFANAPTGYPVKFRGDGMLVDDPGHARDLTTILRFVFGKVFEAKADTWWHEVGASLDPKERDLRGWLASSFFEHHLKRYSKSRRKAPILWQLSVPSGRYSIWLYAHRLTRDSFFQIQNDLVTPKLAHEEGQLANLIESARANPSANDRKDISLQESAVEEIRALFDEVKRVAPLWNPTLDDGVVLTMAPFWRLVPQHKAWQKELKSKWDELTAGKYDWAHVAMHLWPERVVPRCTRDRSLAIAHGLESIFWMEGDDGKWIPRPSPLRTVDEIVRERTSIAVKAALKGLLDVPVTNASRARRRVEAVT